MSSSNTPRIAAYFAEASIAKGKAVKHGSTKGWVAVGAANTDHVFGIAQVEVTASGDSIEVALPGGGAKALAGETIAAGDSLVSHTDGTLVKANASGDRVVAVAQESAVANDLFEVEVVQFDALAAE